MLSDPTLERDFATLKLDLTPVSVNGVEYTSVTYREPTLGDVVAGSEARDRGVDIVGAAYLLGEMARPVPRAAIMAQPVEHLDEPLEWIEQLSLDALAAHNLSLSDDEDESEDLAELRRARGREYTFDLAVPIVLPKKTLSSVTVRAPTVADNMEFSKYRNETMMMLKMVERLTGLTRSEAKQLVRRDEAVILAWLRPFLSRRAKFQSSGAR